jgi:hypothetical protein
MSITNYFLNTQTNGLYINYPKKVNNVDTLDSSFNSGRTPPYLVSEKWGSLVLKCNVGAGFMIGNNTANITDADPFYINFASQVGLQSDIKLPGDLQFTTTPPYKIIMNSSGVTINSDVTVSESINTERINSILSSNRVVIGCNLSVSGYLTDYTYTSNSTYATINKALNVSEIRSQASGLLTINSDVSMNGYLRDRNITSTDKMVSLSTGRSYAHIFRFINDGSFTYNSFDVPLTTGVYLFTFSLGDELYAQTESKAISSCIAAITSNVRCTLLMSLEGPNPLLVFYQPTPDNVHFYRTAGDQLILAYAYILKLA